MITHGPEPPTSEVGPYLLKMSESLGASFWHYPRESKPNALYAPRNQLQAQPVISPSSPAPYLLGAIAKLLRRFGEASIHGRPS